MSEHSRTETTVEATQNVTGEEQARTAASAPRSRKTRRTRMSRGTLVRRRFFRSKTAVFGLIGICLIVLLAVVGPHIAQWGFQDVDRKAFLKPPSVSHWWGTTQGGRDVFALTMEGLRKSLMIGASVALLQTFIAAVVGATAAYFGKIVEKVILWIIDLMLVVPSFLIIAVLSQRAKGGSKSLLLFIFLLSAFGWMLTARVIRSMTLSVKNLEYVTAARYMSVPAFTIIRRHIIPNVSSYLIIDCALAFVSAVMSETVLSYFGFGVQPPNTSLGVIISQGQGMATTYPWVFLAPALILTTTLICVNFVGDGLRDAIDPTSKSGGRA